MFSGTLKNAGDYLITNRCKEILEDYFRGCEISTFIRNKTLNDEELEQVNNSDCIVIGGGPCYKHDLHPQTIPLVPDLNRIKPKIFMLGGGWYGDTSNAADVWKYRFSDTSKTLLDRVSRDSSLFGCRDYYAVRVLNNNGYKNSIMTGCPAWYDLEKIHSRIQGKVDIKEIGISDPADIKHFGKQSIDLCKYLISRFPKAHFHYFFHRGTKQDEYTDKRTIERIQALSEVLKEMKIEIHDIAYSAEGFKIYNECDLHIGHRVHAHIYNLSQRKPSILIEEDSRGAGVNEALGLWNIKAYEKKREVRTDLVSRAYYKVIGRVTVNPYAINDTAAYLDYCEQTDFGIFDNVFSQMESYYENMKKYLNHMRIVLEGK